MREEVQRNTVLSNVQCCWNVHFQQIYFNVLCLVPPLDFLLLISLLLLIIYRFLCLQSWQCFLRTIVQSSFNKTEILEQDLLFMLLLRAGQSLWVGDSHLYCIKKAFIFDNNYFSSTSHLNMSSHCQKSCSRQNFPNSEPLA